MVRNVDLHLYEAHLTFCHLLGIKVAQAAIPGLYVQCALALESTRPIEAAFLQEGNEDGRPGDAERSATPRRMIPSRRNPAHFTVPGDVPMANQ